MRNRSRLLSVTILVSLGVAVTDAGPGPTARILALQQQDIAPARRPMLLEAYGRLQLSFEPNVGQTDSRVKFLAHAKGYTLFLTATEAVLSLSPPIRGARRAAKGSGVRIKLVGGNLGARVLGLDELPGKSNYFIGNDPAKWRTNVPSYTKVRCEDVYPGVDLIYYGNQDRLEYDFVVGPGSDPGPITFGIEGVERMRVDTSGDLLLHAQDGELRLQRPKVYQESGGVRQEITGKYVLTADYHVGLQLAAYDTTRTLVIDPVVSYATYLGGSSRDEGNSIAVDSAGNAYVTGQTNSVDFPTVAAVQSSLRGGQSLVGDVFVAKLNAQGSALIFSTYLGGSGQDIGTALALDKDGNAYVAGFTTSSNFPTVKPLQDGNRGGGDAFVAKLSATGSTLLYSTLLGGTDYDGATGIAVDAQGVARIVGSTASSDFPTKNPLWAFSGDTRVLSYRTRCLWRWSRLLDLPATQISCAFRRSRHCWQHLHCGQH